MEKKKVVKELCGMKGNEKKAEVQWCLTGRMVENEGEYETHSILSLCIRRDGTHVF